ncbi:helix-turn-helix domain-containing protein [Micromonospora sp. NPDC049175]|uniref:helix-turn-helix domain-containing protein n=1 Tax=Micromonospora sp. NPDC049175 TaxID=3364266 RepID=UPI003715E15C
MTPPRSPRPAQLGPLLARYRLARGWSQQRAAAELCAAAGVPTLSRHEVSRWERQRRVPGGFWLGWLAVVLDVPLVTLTEAAAGTRRAGATRAPGAGRTAGAGTRPAGRTGPGRTDGTRARVTVLGRAEAEARRRSGRAEVGPDPGVVSGPTSNAAGRRPAPPQAGQGL